MAHCYYANFGWCADYAPLFVWIFIPPLWFLFTLVARRIGMKMTRTGLKKLGRAVCWFPLALLTCTGAYFIIAEQARKCIIRAASIGTEESIKDMRNCLAIGGSVDAVENRNGATALYIAVKNRNMRGIDYLLSRGAKVNPYSQCDINNPIHGLLQDETPSPQDRMIAKNLMDRGARPCDFRKEFTTFENRTLPWD